MRRSSILAPVALAVVAMLAACGDDDAPPPQTTTSAVTPAPVPGTTPAANTGWERAFGPALFIGNTNGGVEVVVPQVTDSTFADSATWAGVSLDGTTQVEFFSRAGRVSTAALPAPAPRLAPDLSSSCVGWPQLRGIDGLSRDWIVGFAPGHAVALPLDAIESLARGDSARLAAEVTRLASQIPNDTALAFAGLPFAVRTAYRVRLGGDTTVLVAELTRRIGQEADPREQHVFLVAERPDSAATWQLAWQTRSSGGEDQVETRELLAAVALGPARTPAVVIGVSDNDGNSYTLVTRQADGTWRDRWSSAYAGC